MLSAAHRLTDAAQFRSASRRGRRASSTSLVTHLLESPDPAHGVPRVGFVVSKAVGNAVTRNRTQRRLRHLMRARVEGLSRGSVLVVRAKPAAATATYAMLGADLDRCLERVVRAERTTT